METYEIYISTLSIQSLSFDIKKHFENIIRIMTIFRNFIIFSGNI